MSSLVPAGIPKCYVLLRSAEEMQRNHVARTIATVRLAKENNASVS